MGKRSDTDDLTARLLDAAADVFAERGYEGAGVAEIARRAGVTTGAIYSRYSGKAELLLDAVDRRMGQHDHLLSGGTGSESAVDLLTSLAGLLVEDTADGHHVFLEAVVAARKDPDLAERLRFRVMEEDARLTKLVEEAKADGQFEAALSTQAIVRLAHAIGIGMTVSTVLDLPMPTEAEWAEVVDRLIAAAGSNPTQPGEER